MLRIKIKGNNQACAKILPFMIFITAIFTNQQTKENLNDQQQKTVGTMLAHKNFHAVIKTVYKQ